MWRAFFFAVGIMLVIVGVECLLIDSATLSAEKREIVQVNEGWLQTPRQIEVGKRQVVRPSEWIPWSLLASGAIVLLYSFTLPKRWGNKPAAS
ncbi:MAG: hypothetical protein KDA45_02850 [Planctomycetales bacterium]|nr:hypothetical protein [Planctomycetales bacterium]